METLKSEKKEHFIVINFSERRNFRRDKLLRTALAFATVFPQGFCLEVMRNSQIHRRFIGSLAN